jgi:ABC-type cobalamin transport system permease subunit
MSPETHLLASWILAAKTTRSPRDCALVTLAGILPDADGLGLVLDVAWRLLGLRPTAYYQEYHHVLLHGAPGALLIAGILACFARDRWRVALLALVAVHLHILCDLLGSRGPDANDFWPIYYFSPLRSHPMWLWRGQWALDAWPNHLINVALLAWALWLAPRLGHSFVGLFSRRADTLFVGILRKWRADLSRKPPSAFGA